MIRLSWARAAIDVSVFAAAFAAVALTTGHPGLAILVAVGAMGLSMVLVADPEEADS